VLATRLRCVDNGQAIPNGIDAFNAASGGTDMGLAFRLAVGVGILGVLSLFGCASTAPRSEDLATNPLIAVPEARTSPPGTASTDSEENAPTVAAAEIDPDCSYLTFKVRTPIPPYDADKRAASYKTQKRYMDKFSAHLERVGFKAWEPVSVRLKQEGFRELGAFVEPLFSQEVGRDRGELTARETAELEKILAKLTTHEEARADEIMEAIELSTWNVDSNVLDIAGPELKGVSEGDRAVVWNWLMEKRDTVLDGALRVDLFTDPWASDPSRRFGRIVDLLLTLESNFDVEAARAADWAAAVFLPHARQLCADMNATLLEEEAKLERIRDQLTEEIIRVRERRAEQEKRLKLEVE